jgi:hypothetical protein
MAIGNYYPVSGTVVDQDLFLGTKAGNNNTVNYTAQTVANYLNTNSKVAIGGQISFRFDISPNIPKTISFSGGGGSGTPFSSITQLIVSGIDLSSTDITIFLNYLNGSEILLAQQNQPNLFGNYKITSYTQIGTSNFYTLGLQFIGGNGTITENTYYNLSSFVLSSGVDVPTLNQVLTAGNTSIIDAKVGNLYSYDNVNADYGIVQFYDSGVALKGASTNNLLFYNDDTGTVKFSNGTYAPTLNFAGVGNNVYTFQNANGTLAFLSDIPSLSGYVPYTGATQAVNLGAFNLLVNGVSVGKGAGSGIANVAVGQSALGSATTGNQNVAVGTNALANSTTAGNNTAIGQNAMATNISGGGNTSVGNFNLFSNTIGVANTAVGNYCMFGNTTGGFNTAMGNNALQANTTASNNSAFGWGALQNNTIGTSNTALGTGTLAANTIGIENTSVGRNALGNNTNGNYNTAIGFNSLVSNTTGGSNTGVGKFSLTTSTTGEQNTALGASSLPNITTGSFNVGIGVNSMANSSTAYNNVAIGYAAIQGTFGPTNVGYNNVGIGYYGLRNNTNGYENIGVGYNSLLLNPSDNNSIVIGSNTTGIGSNTVVLGNDSIVTTALKGDVGIGTTSPSQKLHISGNLRVTGAIYDSTNSPGTAGQVLSSTVTGTDWVNAGTVTSIGMTVPSAFNVTPSTITSSGTFAITGAGVASQYVRGDGTLANFPTSTGGGASVSYYLNGSISQGTIGGVAYKEMNSVPVIGTGTDFTINADGYIAQFITDVGDPNKLLIPSGNWNFETYFSASSGGGSPRFYIELYKYNGTTFTLIASNSTSPEFITGGTSIDLYFSALAVPPTTLLVTDRLAVRFYVIHSGRTITMHTENSHLSQVITTFSSGLTALNGLTSQVQYFAVGTSGTDFNISSATDTHTFNLPTASAANRGALSSADWTAFNSKANASGTTNYVPKFTGAATLGNSQIFDNGTNVGIGTASPSLLLQVGSRAGIGSDGVVSWGQALTGNNRGYLSWDTDIASVNAISNLVFRTNTSSERMRITSTGNVGIGTTSPSSILDVQSAAAVVGPTLKVSNTNAGGGNLLQLDRATNSRVNGINFSTAGVEDWSLGVLRNGGSPTQVFSLSYQSGSNINSTGFAVTSAGNVGIGTTTPAQLLDVFGTGMVKQLYINYANNDFISNINFPAIYGTFNSGAAYPFLTAGNLIIQPRTTLGRDIVFANGATTPTVKMVIDSTGNVGIGTTTPSYKLDIVGFANSTSGFRVTDGTIDNRMSWSSGNVGFFGTVSNHPIAFNTNLSERMRITSAGSVLINNTASYYGYQSQVRGAFYSYSTADDRGIVIFPNQGTPNIQGLIPSSGNANNIALQGAGGNVGIGTTAFVGSIKLAVNGQIGGPTFSSTYLDLTGGIPELRGNGGIGFYATSGDHVFYGASSVERVRITNVGNVGIGTSSPAAKLHTVGDGLFSSNTNTNLTINSNGGVSILTLTTSAGTQSIYGGVGGLNNMDFYTASGFRMRIDPTGNVGIGTSTPVGRLDVRAPGPLSIDTAFRVRNSADSNNLMIINGAGGIGVGTTSPLPSAVLDINSTTQGFLPPRMTNAQRTSISLPAVGLMVYCTDATEGLYIYKSTGWTFII